MKLSEVIDALNKAKQFLVTAGEDADVVLHAAEGDAETVIHAIGVQISGASSPGGTQVTLTHGTAPPPAAEPEPEPVAETEPEPAS